MIEQAEGAEGGQGISIRMLLAKHDLFCFDFEWAFGNISIRMLLAKHD